jgi:hypothetical protein
MSYLYCLLCQSCLPRYLNLECSPIEFPHCVCVFARACAIHVTIFCQSDLPCWSRWPRGLRRECRAARFLGLRVRIPAALCVVRYLCDSPFCRPEESYRVYIIGLIRCSNNPLHFQWVYIRCSNNPLHLQWVYRRIQTKRATEKERIVRVMKIPIMFFSSSSSNFVRLERCYMPTDSFSFIRNSLGTDWKGPLRDEW